MGDGGWGVGGGLHPCILRGRARGTFCRFIPCKGRKVAVGPEARTNKQTMIHPIFFFNSSVLHALKWSVAQPKERKNSSVEKGRNGGRRKTAAASDSVVGIAG